MSDPLREQSDPQAPPLPPQGGHAFVSSPSLSAPQSAPAPSRLEISGRVARLLAERALWAADQGWRLLLPRLGWVMLTGLLVGVIAVLSFLLVVPRLFASTADPADPRVAIMPPAPAVESFLRGQQTFDADLMWESFSDELRQSLEGREITRDTLAERIETERRAGQRYSDYKYIGGVQLSGRQVMYFYAVDYSSPQERGTMSFVFTVDGDGKIISVQ